MKKSFEILTTLQYNFQDEDYIIVIYNVDFLPNGIETNFKVEYEIFNNEQEFIEEITDDNRNAAEKVIYELLYNMVAEMELEFKKEQGGYEQ